MHVILFTMAALVNVCLGHASPVVAWWESADAIPAILESAVLGPTPHVELDRCDGLDPWAVAAWLPKLIALETGLLYLV